MPIYEYKCGTCGNRIEKIQKVSDEPLTVCENCGGKLEKQVSLSGFQFKGAGWYVTDYAGKKADKGGKADTAPGADAKGDKTEKSDAPAAEKSEKNSSSESTTGTETA